MRILLDQAVHHHKNKGNNALLEVTIKRLREFWPQASIEIISLSPHLCKVFFPGTFSVSPRNFQIIRSRLDILHKILPNIIWRLLFELREALNNYTGQDLPSQKLLTTTLDRFRRSNQQSIKDPGNNVGLKFNSPSLTSKPLDLNRAIADYDLYIAVGGGYLCDDDKRFVFPLLDRLEASTANNVSTVMVGQGIGPIEDPELISRARDVLPFVDYIFVREEQLARNLLESLKVPCSKVFMTGDDAIELAYDIPEHIPRLGIGLSLRVASYTEINNQTIKAIRPFLIQSAKKYDAEIIEAPIDVNDADHEYIKMVTIGYPKITSNWKKFETPSEIIKRISRCRLMISGTYHGAVFALSQGIPVIALTRSAYQTVKVSGLATEFGKDGCQVVRLDENFEKNFPKAVDFAWSSADTLRPHLMTQAKRQIMQGRDAYRKIFNLVKER